jgi:tetratricopeptide (TPR) repeat protein
VRICRNLGILACLAGVSLPAQTLLTLPEDSPRAVTAQRIGVTDVTIVYHRPFVKGRKIWGGLAPYGQVWRAGANENTTIEFSTPVMVEGHALAKGIYGLHMIPNAEEWTVIFSKASGDWGSFAYDQKEDALRVTVKPQTAEFHEALAYDFDALKWDSAIARLSWEKVAVPFAIAVAHDVVIGNLREQLRGGVQYNWVGWDEAAQFSLQTKTDLEQGLKWASTSIQNEERFENLMTKSQLLTAMNRASEATQVHDRALDVGSPLQLYQFARQLQLRDKKPDEAFAAFRIIVKRAPDSLAGHIAQGRLYSAAGNFDGAVKEVKAAQALPGNSDQQVKALDPLIKRLENKEDINK